MGLLGFDDPWNVSAMENKSILDSLKNKLFS